LRNMSDKKKMGFFVGFILLIVSIIANCFASAQKEKMEIRNEAIVFAPSITIKTIAIDGAITFRTAQCNGVR